MEAVAQARRSRTAASRRAAAAGGRSSSAPGPVLRLALRASLCAALFALPCAAGWVENRGGRTVIHVTAYVLPDPSDTSTYAQAEAAGVEAFRRRFPCIFAERYAQKYKADTARYGHYNWDDVSVELHPFSGIQVEGVEGDLLAIAGGTAPDILYVNFRRSDTYIRNNFLYPLDKPEDGYLAAMSRKELDFRVHPKIWPVIRRKGPDGAVRVWALPYGGALGKVLLFRKDLFDRLKIPYPSSAWTWNDMLDAARALTDPERNTYGLWLMRGKHEAWYWLTYLWSAGGEVMTHDTATDRWQCVFDSEQAAIALDFYTRLSAEKWIDSRGRIRRGYSCKDAGSPQLRWDRGEIGMMIGYVDEKLFSTVNPETTGMVPVPLGPTGRRGAELNSRMLGLFSEIQHPAVRDVAWEYIRFYDSKEAMEIKALVLVQGGLGPFVNPKYLRMFGYSDLERLAPRGWAETFEIAIETGRPEPYGPHSNIAYELMTTPIQQAEHLALNDRLPEDPQSRLAVLRTLLRAACKRANQEMLGIVPPEERAKRRIAAAILLAAMAVAFALVPPRIARLFSAGRPPAELSADGQTRPWKKYAWPYVLLTPAILAVLLWHYVPLTQGLLMAFKDYRLLGKSTWVWLDNFGDVLFDNAWWNAVYNSLRYSLLVIALTFLPPLFWPSCFRKCRPASCCSARFTICRP